MGVRSSVVAAEALSTPLQLCAAMTAWILTGSIDATRVGVLWVAGTTCLSVLWLATQLLCGIQIDSRSAFAAA